MLVGKSEYCTPFVGNEPPFLLFEMQYHSLSFVVESHKSHVGTGPLQFEANPAVEIAIVGIVAQFEAYCKHQFAALVNLNVNLLERFAERRDQSSIGLREIVILIDDRLSTLGALIAEKYDFGSAKQINALFRDLLNVSPFSKQEAERFDHILCERHLLVHHGGIQTLEWTRKRGREPVNLNDQMFRGRIKIDEEGYFERSEFIFQMAMKIARSTVNAAKSLENDRVQDGELKTKYSPLLKGLFDDLD